MKSIYQTQRWKIDKSTLALETLHLLRNAYYHHFDCSPYVPPEAPPYGERDRSLFFD